MIHALHHLALPSWSHGFGACGDRRAGAWHGGAAAARGATRLPGAAACLTVLSKHSSFCATRKPRDPHMIAECVLNEVQAPRLWADLEAFLDHSLIVGVAWTEHHSVLAKGDRLPVAIGKLERTSTDPLGRGGAKPAPPISLKPGTQLVREWRGVTHMVLIHADGIEWRGQRYRSLSMAHLRSLKGYYEPEILVT